MTVLLSGRQGSKHVGGGAEFHSVDVDTDSVGDGTATVSYDSEFDDGDVVTSATWTSHEGDNAQLAVTASGATQATVSITGASTTNGTVTVHFLVAGNRATDR